MVSKKKPPAKGAKTMPIGKRFTKGGPGGPGRPALPKEFKDSAASSLEIVERVALTGYFDRQKKQPAMPSIRWRAIERHIDSTYGLPGKARVEGDPLPKDPAELVKLLEQKVAEAAIAGNDSEAAVRMLEALEPTRWGKKPSDLGDDDEVDLPDWTPMVKQ